MRTPPPLPTPPPAVRRARHVLRSIAVWNAAALPLLFVLCWILGRVLDGRQVLWIFGAWLALAVLSVLGWMGLVAGWYMRFSLGGLLGAVGFGGACVSVALVAPDPFNHLAIVALAFGAGGTLVKIARHDPELGRSTFSAQWEREGLGMGEARAKPADDGEA